MRFTINQAGVFLLFCVGKPVFIPLENSKKNETIYPHSLGV